MSTMFLLTPSSLVLRVSVISITAGMLFCFAAGLTGINAQPNETDERNEDAYIAIRERLVNVESKVATLNDRFAESKSINAGERLVVLEQQSSFIVRLLWTVLGSIGALTLALTKAWYSFYRNQLRAQNSVHKLEEYMARQREHEKDMAKDVLQTVDVRMREICNRCIMLSVNDPAVGPNGSPRKRDGEDEERP